MVDREEVHPVVTLLVERMKSHPEEFEPLPPNTPVAEEDPRSRWSYAIYEIMEYGTDADIAMLDEHLRAIRLDKTHQLVLDELLNGEERRRAQERMRIDSMGQLGVGTAAPGAGYPALNIDDGTLYTSVLPEIKIELGV